MRFLQGTRLFVVACLALTATSCAGNGAGSISPTRVSDATVKRTSALGNGILATPVTTIFALPKPFDPAVDVAAKDSTPQENSEGGTYVYDRIADLKAIGMLSSSLSGSDRKRDNTYNGSGDGDGVVIGISNIGGVYAGQTVNTSFRPGGQNVVYAPTSRPGDPSCLEMTSAYDSAHGNYFFGFYSFCATAYPGNFYGRKYYTDSATSAYLASYDGQTIVTPEIREDSSGVWHGYLYNYSTKVYEDLVDVGGSCGPGPSFTHSDSPGGCNLYGGTPNGGWDFYETH